MSDREPSVGAIGWITFAGFVMIVSGGFSILQGLAWLISSDNFAGKDLIFSGSPTSWGWVQVIVGAIVLLSGFGVFTGNVLARTVGVFAVALNMLTAFASMTFYPFWGFIIILIDISIIWALTVHGRDIQKAQGMGA